MIFLLCNITLRFFMNSLLTFNRVCDNILAEALHIRMTDVHHVRELEPIRSTVFIQTDSWA